jgi:hypothetical protein
MNTSLQTTLSVVFFSDVLFLSVCAINNFKDVGVFTRDIATYNCPCEKKQEREGIGQLSQVFVPEIC